MRRFGFPTTGLEAFLEGATAKYHRLLMEETFNHVKAVVRGDNLSRVYPTTTLSIILVIIIIIIICNNNNNKNNNNNNNTMRININDSNYKTTACYWRRPVLLSSGLLEAVCSVNIQGTFSEHSVNIQ
jgi:hypothetical protein